MNQLLAQADTGGFWLPRGASTYSDSVDLQIYLIGGMTIFFTLLIVAVLIWIVVKYRYREGVRTHSDPDAKHHSLAIEIAWSIPPFIIVIWVFYAGFRAYMNQYIAPPNTYEIRVTAQKWAWQFEYPNGGISDKLYVRDDVPTRLILTSNDVIHSLFIPEFRIKKDAVPGRYNDMWFEPTERGTFRIFCTEYCGTEHSRMFTEVVVLPPAEFAKALEDLTDPTTMGTPVEAGETLYRRYGCASCHSVDGSDKIGPSFLNLYGYERQMAGGSTVVADENYLRESILYSSNQIVAGYQNVMPSFAGRLRDSEIYAMIAWQKTLSDKFQGTPETWPDEFLTGEAEGEAGDEDGQSPVEQASEPQGEQP